jgi:hypothetical protein
MNAIVGNYQCCPFCTSKDIKSEVVDYESFIYGMMQKLHGKCNQCHESWVSDY